MLAALMIPAYNLAIRSRQNAECSRKLRTAVDAFQLYASEKGDYPAQQAVGATTVAEMEGYYFPYFKINWWGDATELGGRWRWVAGYNGIDFAVAIAAPSVSTAQLTELDKMIDDGNLDAGKFRYDGTNSLFIIKE
jgi:hypothetical protein